MTNGRERVLVVEPDRVLAQRTARDIIANGGEAVVVASAEEARRAEGTFDRGSFAFNLPDGCGIVLAAEMLLDDRLRKVDFFHPSEERMAPPERPSDLHTTSRAPELTASRKVA